MMATQWVVMAGGSGTRFWPWSRRSRPKQLLALASQQSLLAETFARLGAQATKDAGWMVIGEPYAEICHQQVPAVSPERVLREPVGRNTAAAIGLAAVHIAKTVDPSAVMAVLPADHFVLDGPAFCRAIEQAARHAERGVICTLGIQPTYPETGYGYIEQSDKPIQEASDGVYGVKRFCEKPDYATAKKFVEAGTFYWNAGVFVAQAATVLHEISLQLPQLSKALETIQASLGSEAYAQVLATQYDSIESISFDHGIMEGAEQVAVLPTDCGWSDVGSFAALAAMQSAGQILPSCMGRSVCVESKGAHVFSTESEHVVAVLGLPDVVVMHTADATLVMPKAQAQQVRDVVSALDKRGWDDVL